MNNSLQQCSESFTIAFTELSEHCYGELITHCKLRITVMYMNNSLQQCSESLTIAFSVLSEHCYGELITHCELQIRHALLCRQIRINDKAAILCMFDYLPYILPEDSYGAGKVITHAECGILVIDLNSNVRSLLRGGA
jgi:hypothetical protein